jgi:hypothetical protein
VDDPQGLDIVRPILALNVLQRGILFGTLIDDMRIVGIELIP